MKDDNDTVLVQQCLRGDKTAFEAVVDKYQKPLFNIAYRLVGKFEDAEDITQTVFIKAFQGLRGYDSRYKFFSWLYRIAVNESINHRNTRRPEEQLDERAIAHYEAPESVIDARERSAVIQKAVSELKEEYRVVIVLKHFQELSYEEISGILGIPTKTVKSRLFTARQTLKEKLSEQRYL